MIKLQPSPSFKFRVEVAVPGSNEPGAVMLVGRHKGQVALKEWGERAKQMEGRDAEFLLEVIEDWSEVADADAKPVKFTRENFGAFLDAYPGSSLAIFQAYIRELSAGRTKN